MSYSHTQIGYAIIIGFIAAGAVLLINDPPSYLGLAILIVCGLLFPTLTVKVSDDQIKWYFGPGFIKKQINISDIRKTSLMKTHWYYGYGVRLVSGGKLYTVSGSQAVKLELKNGEIFMLASDEAEALLKAIESQREQA